MSDEYDNNNYDPDYYDKEFRDAYPDVYGNDEYAQQFKPVKRSAYKPVRRRANEVKRPKNEELTEFLKAMEKPVYANILKHSEK